MAWELGFGAAVKRERGENGERGGLRALSRSGAGMVTRAASSAGDKGEGGEAKRGRETGKKGERESCPWA